MSDKETRFNEIVEKYDKLIHMFTHRYFVNGYTKEDMYQEYLMEIWNKMDKYDAERSRFITFIYTVLQNFTYSMIRKNRSSNEELLLLDECVRNGDDTETTYLEMIAYNEKDTFEQAEKLLEVIWKEIDKNGEFTELDYKIAKLYFLEDMTIREIGSKLYVSKSSVHRRIAKITEKMREELKEKESLNLWYYLD